MRLIVCGGRDYQEREHVHQVLDTMISDVDCIISGAAPGADSLAAQWAEVRGVPLLLCPAHWNTFGRKAGPMRNEWMITIAKGTHVLAFPGGRGTANMVKLAEKYNLPVERG